MAERNKENDKQRIQPKTAAYWLVHLLDRREASHLAKLYYVQNILVMAEYTVLPRSCNSSSYIVC